MAPATASPWRCRVPRALHVCVPGHRFLAHLTHFVSGVGPLERNNFAPAGPSHALSSTPQGLPATVQRSPCLGQRSPCLGQCQQGLLRSPGPEPLNTFTSPCAATWPHCCPSGSSVSRRCSSRACPPASRPKRATGMGRTNLATLSWLLRSGTQHARSAPEQHCKMSHFGRMCHGQIHPCPKPPVSVWYVLRIPKLVVPHLTHIERKTEHSKRTHMNTCCETYMSRLPLFGGRL